MDIRGILEREFGLPVFVDNDANCFAFGEKIFGKGREFSNFVGVTLGTGVGSGIISAGRLLPDANCGSGEFGEVRIGGVKFDDWCGSHFFPDETGMSGAELSVLARMGDAKALKAFEEYGRRLSELVKLIVLVLDPEAVIFGGSIAKSFDFFGDAIRANLATTLGTATTIRMNSCRLWTLGRKISLTIPRNIAGQKSPVWTTQDMDAFIGRRARAKKALRMNRNNGVKTICRMFCLCSMTSNPLSNTGVVMELLFSRELS